MEEIAKFFDGDDAVDVGEAAVADMKERGIATSGVDEKRVGSVTQIEVVDAGHR
jgi:hypothetical protein